MRAVRKMSHNKVPSPLDNTHLDGDVLLLSLCGGYSLFQTGMVPLCVLRLDAGVCVRACLGLMLVCVCACALAQAWSQCHRDGFWSWLTAHRPLSTSQGSLMWGLVSVSSAAPTTWRERGGIETQRVISLWQASQIITLWVDVQNTDRQRAEYRQTGFSSTPPTLSVYSQVY
jgi:hypothetical protein